MCAGDDKTCPEFELHHRKFKETLDRERRSFLKSSFAAAGGAAALSAGGISLVTPEIGRRREASASQRAYHHLPANADTALGLFRKTEAAGRDRSGDFITTEALTHHANDDAERMVKGDLGAERIPVDREEGCRPAWLRTDGCFAVRSRCRRRPGRPYPHWTGLRPRC